MYTGTESTKYCHYSRVQTLVLCFLLHRHVLPVHHDRLDLLDLPLPLLLAFYQHCALELTAVNLPDSEVKML